MNFIFQLKFTLLISVILLTFAIIFTYFIRSSAGCSDVEVKTREVKTKTLQSALYAIKIQRGLGNVLFELISFLGIARQLNRTPFIDLKDPIILTEIFRDVAPVYPELIKQFKFDFINETNISKEEATKNGCCRYDDPERLKKNNHEKLLIEGRYFQSFKYFRNIENEVKQLLSPLNSFSLKADEKIPKTSENDFIICVHTRRGDFIYEGSHEPSSELFTRFSTDFLVDKYKKEKTRNISVVLIGNDMEWNFSVFKDKVHYLSEDLKELKSEMPFSTNLLENSPNYKVILTTSSREADLAFSPKYCDSVLITAPSSTFGWWLGYLSKSPGDVYYRDIRETGDHTARLMTITDFYPPEWKMLRTKNNSLEVFQI